MLLLVEGNIGAGKTNFCECLSRFFNRKYVKVIQEPLNEWTNVPTQAGVKNVLQEYYNDKPRYAYTFQTWVVVTKFMELEDALKKYPIVVVERSIWADRFVFMKMLYDSGVMTDLEFTLSGRWFDFFTQRLPRIDGVVYLRASTDTCKDRIGIRGRPEESKIEMNYLKKIENYYDRWLYNDMPCFNVLTVNADVDMNTNPTCFHNVFANMIDNWPFLEQFKFEHYQSTRRRSVPQFFHVDRNARFEERPDDTNLEVQNVKEPAKEESWADAMEEGDDSEDFGKVPKEEEEEKKVLKEEDDGWKKATSRRKRRFEQRWGKNNRMV